MLEALGVASTSARRTSARCIDEAGVGFLFAQALHPAMRHAGPSRREIGMPTVFNILGPLTNPAGAPAPAARRLRAPTLSSRSPRCWRLGAERALVVHGATAWTS